MSRAKLTVESVREAAAIGRDCLALADQVRAILAQPQAVELERAIQSLHELDREAVTTAIQSARVTASRLAQALETLDNAVVTLTAPPKIGARRGR